MPGHLLGRALAGIVNTIDPEIVILLGEGVEAWNHWSYGFEPAPPFRPHAPQARRSGRRRDLAGRPVGPGCGVPRARDTVRRGGRTGEQGRLVRERLTEPSPRDGSQGAAR